MNSTGLTNASSVLKIQKVKTKCNVVINEKTASVHFAYLLQSLGHNPKLEFAQGLPIFAFIIII